MRILLIAGGWSSEREVSINGSRIVEKALFRLGHEVTFYDPAFPGEFAGDANTGSLSGLMALA